MAGDTNIGSASVEFIVDGSQAVVALDQIEEKAGQVDVAAGKAATALGGIGDQAGSGAQKVDRATQQMISSVQRATAVVEAGQKGTAAYFETIASQRAGLNADALRPYIERLREVQSVQQQIAETRANDSFITSLQRQAAAIGKTRADLLELEAAQRGLSSQAAPLIQRLRESERAVQGLAVSTAQTTAALRTLPAQFTDIATQLAGGQNPLLILLQQGGQIKDSFGGIGPAIRGIASAISPAVIALGGLGAVLGAVGLAYNQGSKEQDEFARKLILTGNATGTTVGQLNEMAKAISANVGTQGRAAEVLAALAGSADIGAAGIQRIAEAAIRLERVGGPAAEETAKQFASLAREPLQAAIKLNEQTNFLTSSLLNQIKALQDQGKAADAARVAQEAYAGALEGRTAQLEARLGTLEKAWRGIIGAAKGAWDAMLNIGRPDTLQEQLAAAQKRVEEAQKLARLPAFSSSPLANVEAAKQQVAYLQEQIRLDTRAADAAARRTQATAAYTELLKERDKYLSLEVQRRREIEQVQRQAATSRNEGGGFTREQEAKLIDDINKKYDERARSSKKMGDAYAAERDAAKEWAAALEKANKIQADAEGKTLGLSKAQEALVEYLKSPAYAKNSEEMRQIAVEAFKAAIASEQMADATARLNAILDEGQRVYAKYLVDLDQGVTAAQEQTQRLLDEERAAALAAKANISLAEALALVNIERLKAKQASEGLDDAAAFNAYGKMIEEQEKQLQILRQKASREGTQKAADDARREWERTNEQIGQSLADALIQGGRSAGDVIKDYFRSLVLTPLVKAIVQPVATAVNGVVGSVINGVTGGASGYGGALMQGASAANSIYQLYQGGGVAGSALAAANYASVYSGAAYGTGFGTQQSAMLAAQEAGMVSQAGGSALGTAATWAGYAALIYAAVQYADKIYGEGFTGEKQIGGTSWYDKTFEAQKTNLLQSLGMSEKWAQILGGSVRLNHLFGRAEPRVTGEGVLGTFSGGGFTGERYADILEKGGVFKSDKRYTVAGELDETIRSFFADAASAVVDQAKEYGAALGLAPELMAGITKDVKVQLTGDLEKDKAEITKALGEYGAALLEGYKDAVKPLSIFGETVQQTIERVGTAILGANDALSQIGVGTFAKSIAGGQGAVDLTELFGGTDQLKQAAGSFFDTFFTDTQKIDTATAKLSSTFTSLGLTMPSVSGGADVARAAYVDLVQAQNVNTEAGRKNLAALLGLSGAFNQVADAADAAAKKEAERAAAVAGKSQDLEIQLLRALGRESEAVALQRQRELAELAKLESSLNVVTGTFTDTQRAIYAAADAAQAASTSQGLQISLLRALGQEEAAVRLEREIQLSELAELEKTLGVSTGAFTGLQRAINAATDAAVAGQKVRDVLGGLGAVAPDFLGGQALIGLQATLIQDKLGFAGLGEIPIEQILGATKEDILAFWQAVGVDGKLAIQQVYPEWVALQELMLNTEIVDGGLASSIDDLLSVMQEINPPAKTLADTWRDNKREIDQITDALNELKGVRAGTAVEQMIADLQDAVGKRDRLRGVISGNQDTLTSIFAGMVSQRGVDYLKNQESSLAAQFAASGDADIASKLTSVTLDRIKLEGRLYEKLLQDRYDAEYKLAMEAYELRKQTVTLEEQLIENQKDALREQIDGYKRLKDAARQLPEFLGGLRAGNLSNLSFTDRLAQQKTLFERSLETGNDPQGALTAYLQQAQQLYGGATKAYSDIFTAALAQYQMTITDSAGSVDPKLAAAQSQLSALEAIRDEAPELKRAVVDTSEAEITAILSLNGTFGGVVDKLTGDIDRLVVAFEAKLEELLDDQSVIAGKLTVIAEEVNKLREPLTTTATNTTNLANTAETESFRVPGQGGGV
jgi:phage-related minor tail protein